MDKLQNELRNEKIANDGLQKRLENANNLKIGIQKDIEKLKKENYNARQSYGNLANENGRLQKEIKKLMQEQHDSKKEIEELKEKNKKHESEAEKNLEAEEKLKAFKVLATSAKSCGLTVTKQRKERMCAEIHTEKISRSIAQALLKTQKNENDELKNTNKINEERIAILEEQLKKAESVGNKRAAETFEDVAPKKTKRREEMRQDLHNLVLF
uniref:Uncharacterized protein n=1 Tax=Panagrolaimus davidi TaxID=227884 RepID=A0A914QJY5_9BILA